MPRIRSIKPDFWTDEKIVELPIPARLFFIGMWTYADDYGNLSRSPAKLKMQIYPADALDVEPLVCSLLEQGLISEYAVSGHKYIHINGFKRHQRINRPSKSGLVPKYEERDGTTLTEQSPKEREKEKEKEKEIKQNHNPTVKGRGKASRARAQEAPPPSPPPVDPEPDGDEPRKPSQAAVLSAAFKTGNVWGATPANPRIIALAEAGVTPEAVADVCAYAHASLPGERVPVKWALTTLEGWQREGRLSVDVPARANGTNGHAPPRPLTPVQQREADARRLTEGLNRMARWGDGDDGDGEVIDVTATEMSDEHAKRLKNS